MRVGVVRVCGYSRKESLNHATYFLDSNYSFPANTPNDQITYTPTPQRVEIIAKDHVGDDCTRLSNIPTTGEHVLTVFTDPSNPRHVTSLSHVVIF